MQDNLINTFADIDRGMSNLKKEINDLTSAVRFLRDQFKPVGFVVKSVLRSKKAKDRERFLEQCQPLIKALERIDVVFATASAKMEESIETMKGLDFDAIKRLLDFFENQSPECGGMQQPQKGKLRVVNKSDKLKEDI